MSLFRTMKKKFTNSSGYIFIITFCFAWYRTVYAAGFYAGTISDATLNYCDERIIYVSRIAFDSYFDSLGGASSCN